MFINFKNKFVKKFNSSKTIHIDVKFKTQNDLIYYVKNNFVRFCILINVEKQIFEKTHDKNMNIEHAKIYERLFKMVFISKLFRKLKQYIKHCSICDFN